ncbi:MAG: hypothetical protein ACQESG_04960 [Nanobdellota archaeon]
MIGHTYEPEKYRPKTSDNPTWGTRPAFLLEPPEFDVIAQQANSYQSLNPETMALNRIATNRARIHYLARDTKPIMTHEEMPYSRKLHINDDMLTVSFEKGIADVLQPLMRTDTLSISHAAEYLNILPKQLRGLIKVGYIRHAANSQNQVPLVELNLKKNVGSSIPLEDLFE